LRLAFDNGTVYVPGKYHPGLYKREYGYGVGNLGDSPDNTSWDAGLSQNDPNSNLAAFASGLPASAMTGAATANMLGGSTKADIIGGIQAGIMAAAPFTGPAAPFVLMAAQMIGPIAAQFKGCGQTCKDATTIANNAEDAANKLLDQWNATPVKYKSIQQAYLAAQADVWNYISGSCQKIGGQGGQQCIADRQRGGKFDFFIHYVDPVANETDIVPDPPSTATGTSGMSSSVAGLPMPLILGGAGLVILLLTSRGEGSK
jgi:hypothetical protein